MSDDQRFLARWSRRKAEAREGVVPEPTLPTPPVQPEPAPVAATEVPAAPPPTLDDVAALRPDADFARFVAPEVDDTVKRAALKKLFSDPHFNVMDGLDTYIGDYNTPDPLPASMLRKMAQAAALGLFRDDHENADLQLQPDDADRRPGADEGAGHGDDEPA
jgi:hypothetical protein